ATRLVGVAIKEYGKEIIAERSDAVIGLEDHIDKMIAEILEIESDIVIVAREWRKVIKRAAITEGINRVKIVLGQKTQDIITRKDVLATQKNKNKLDIEIIDQTNSSEIVDSSKEEQVLLEEQLSVSKGNKKSDNIIENIKEFQNKETSRLNSNLYSNTSEELEEDIILAESDSSLEKSIWTSSKDKCEGEKIIRAKVAAIK
ncbi:8130_t:CDS:1, partial [Paraglomus occultum]